MTSSQITSTTETNANSLLVSAPGKQGNNTPVFSVEQLNRAIKTLVEGQLQLVWVQGEISNFKAHTSGHFYFTLKDNKSQIRAVMFKGHNARMKFRPGDGLEVIIRGRLTVYEPRGEYQIACEMMEPVGAGALQKAFEDLKEKLKKEGLFDPARKRALPLLPKHVALVTSPTGAAIQDMMKVLSRRNKSVRVTLIPTVVQGEGSSDKIILALQMAFQLKDVDAIIVGRGGGSIEDLWAFNIEKLARVIAQSPVPIISAVGHEIDFTIADFVADVRAPTPSAAAEMVVQSQSELLSRIQSLKRMLVMSVQKILKSERQRWDLSHRRLIDPRRRLQDFAIRNDELFGRLQKSVERNLGDLEQRIQFLVQQLPSPQEIISQRKLDLMTLQTRLSNSVAGNLKNYELSLRKWISVLDSLNPLRVLERGFAVVSKQDRVVISAQNLSPGDSLKIRLYKGEAIVEVVSLDQNVTLASPL